MYWCTDEHKPLRHVHMMMSEHHVVVEAFVQEHIVMNTAEYPSFLLKKLSGVLRGKTTLSSADAKALYYVLNTLVLAEPRIFAQVGLPEGTGLIPTNIIGWHRQICRNPPRVIYYFNITLETML